MLTTLFPSPDSLARAHVWPRAMSDDSALTLIDPATEMPVARLPVATADDAERAVAVACAGAQRWWAAPDYPARQQILSRLITQIEARAEDFAQAISAEMGAPIDFARSKQVNTALSHLRVLLQASQASDDTLPDPAQPAHRVRYEALGVAALITPWNWPLNQTALKVGAALVAGCSMILKPSEYASRSALLFAEAMAAAGAPPEVFQLLLGDGATGAALVATKGVDVVSFTGSTRVGSLIAAEAAPRFVRLNLELGGKSANLLFDDCDLPQAVTQGVAHAFRNTGQSCNAAARMLVQREIYEQVVQLAAETAAQVQVDLPSRSGPHLGALVNGAQFDRVQGLIAGAISQGARCVAGGPGRADAQARGYFPRPTVLADVTPAMEVFRTEIFGPVLTITPFDTEDEALALANDSAFGLAGYVQTTDPGRADRMARGLQVGMVQVNGSSRLAGAPFGGRRASGQGREAGLWGIRAFQDIKSISGAARLDDSDGSA